jgi:hypothetical protein
MRSSFGLFVGDFASRIHDQTRSDDESFHTNKVPLDMRVNIHKFALISLIISVFLRSWARTECQISSANKSLTISRFSAPGMISVSSMVP